MSDREPIKLNIDLDKPDPTNQDLQVMLRYITVQVTFLRRELDDARRNNRHIASLLVVFAITLLIISILKVIVA